MNIVIVGEEPWEVCWKASLKVVSSWRGPA